MGFILYLLSSKTFIFILKLAFKWFRKRYGKKLTDFAYELIGLREKEKKVKGLDSIDAALTNVRILKEITKQSPGLTTTECFLLNLSAYATWVSDKDKRKETEWVKRERQWTRKKVQTDYMDLYNSWTEFH